MAGLWEKAWEASLLCNAEFLVGEIMCLAIYFCNRYINLNTCCILSFIHQKFWNVRGERKQLMLNHHLNNKDIWVPKSIWTELRKEITGFWFFFFCFLNCKTFRTPTSVLNTLIQLGLWAEVVWDEGDVCVLLWVQRHWRSSLELTEMSQQVEQSECSHAC